jgi:hypothetical protein
MKIKFLKKKFPPFNTNLINSFKWAKGLKTVARARSQLHFENFLFTVGLLLKKCSRCSIWDCFPSRHKLLRVIRRMEKKRMDKIIYSVLYYTIIPVFLLGCLCCCTPHSPSVRPFFFTPRLRLYTRHTYI